MKKYSIIAILLGAMVLGGCAVRETDTQLPKATPDAVVEVTPSPTPEPTPVPFELVAENNKIHASPCSGIDDAYSFFTGIWQGSENAEAKELPSVQAASDVNNLSPRADYYCSDDNFLYLLNGTELSIYSLNGAETGLCSTVSVGSTWSSNGDYGEGLSGSEKTPLFVLAAGNRAAVISDCYGYVSANNETSYTEYTGVDILDVSDPGAPDIIAAFGQDGLPENAWIQDNIICVLSEFTAFESNKDITDSYIPSMINADERVGMDPGELYPVSGGSFPGASVAAAYDLTNGVRTGAAALLGVPSKTFAVDRSLYFTSTRYADTFSRTTSLGDEYAHAGCTDIYCLSWSENGVAVSAGTILGLASGPEALMSAEDKLCCAVTLDESLMFSSDKTAESESLRTGVIVTDKSLQGESLTLTLPDNAAANMAGCINGNLVLTDISENASYAADLSAGDLHLEAMESTVIADRFISDGGFFAAFYQPENVKLNISVYTDGGVFLDDRDFGSDHRGTLENDRAFYFDGENGMIGFMADDGYSFYRMDEDHVLTHVKDVFVKGWASDGRLIAAEDCFYILDKKELQVLSADTFEIIFTLVL